MADKRDGGHSSGIESVYMSSDDADSMRETRQDHVFEIQRALGASPHDTDVFHRLQLPSEFQSKGFQKLRERRRSSSVDSINKSSDFEPLSQIAQETSDVTCSIRVSSLPPNISEELINDFFENTKRSGGGDVENVSYDETKKTAIITFQDPKVVESVLKKHKTKPLTIDGIQLQIKEYHKKTDESTEEGLVMAVKVTNLPPKIRKLQIELFFESPKKSGSGNEDLEKVDYDEATHCAIVWFKESEMVTKVLEKHKISPFTLNKQKVEVEEYRPAVDDDESSYEKEDGGRAIKITNIPSETTEEELVLFFENRKKSGGDDVEKVDYNRSTHTAFIWFKEEDVVSRILGKNPLLLRKKQIYVEEVRLDKQKAEKEADKESPDPLCTIEVSGIKDTTSKDLVEFYFDSKKSGGGGVEEVKGEVKDGVIVITFENEDNSLTQKRGIRYQHTFATMSSKTRPHIIAVAIYFGKSYSSYAYSFLSDKENYFRNVYQNSWKCNGFRCEKIPTTLLLDKDKKIVSFGYEAENDYSRMTEKQRNEHYYFRRFRMMLQDKDDKLTLTRNAVLIDIRGKIMPAIDVFACSIKYLKDDFLKIFKKRNLQISITPLTERVTWILTVPAIWDEPGMQFMREAAERAGISRESLLICLEPEAAAVYCKWIQIQRDNDTLNIMKPGCRFLVLDVEDDVHMFGSIGWTIGMAMQEVREDGKIREIIRAQEWDYVNEELKKMLEDIVSKPILEAFQMKYPNDYTSLFQDFKKKQRHKQRCKIVRIKIPTSLLEMTDDIVKSIEEHGLKDEVEMKNDKLDIKIRKFEEIDKKALDNIVVKVGKMLGSDKAEGTKIIIMVGGFSENEILQRGIKDSFPSCTVVIPQNCASAVLNGAVLYGHNPDILAARVVKYTYGVGVNTRFIEDKHNQSKKKLISGIEYCTDKFDIFVQKGTLIHCNEETEKTYLPMYENQTSFRFGVFASNAVEPDYTDGCKLIGFLTVPMPDKTGGIKRRVVIQFKFGATKFTVKGFDKTSKKSVDAKIDFLG